MATPWMTSDDLISAIERKISAPVSQSLFSSTDYLAFANEEMMISQVPAVLMYNQEYFVTTQTVALTASKSRYPIPERAIGQKFRDVFFVDGSGNVLEMTRVDSSNRAHFGGNTTTSGNITQYYIEGNDIVLVPGVGTTPTESIMFVYFLRPNQLVLNERAAICEGFQKTVTVANATLVAGDTLTIDDTVFTAVASGAGALQFDIGATSALTATNLAASITTSDVVGTASATTGIVTIPYTTLSTTIVASNAVALAVQSTQGIVFTDTIPDNLAEGTLVDFLQTKSGHKIKAMDKEIPEDGISADVINFATADVPTDFIVGDYICLSNECIIPQIPTDLHTALAERACSRILSAIGDTQGLEASNQKLQEIEVRQGSLLDNRATNDATKVVPRKSLLRQGKSNKWGWR